MDEYEIMKRQTLLEIQTILASHGIRMRVSACGCCDSPWVRFEYRGQEIADDCEFDFDMFAHGDKE